MDVGELKPSDVELDATELPIPFSLFDLYSWWVFWSYKRYRIVFRITAASKEPYRLDSCSAFPKPHIEGETKEEWRLLANFSKIESERAVINQITITIPYSKQCNRINFVTIPNPPKSMAIAIKTQSRRAYFVVRPRPFCFHFFSRAKMGGNSEWIEAVPKAIPGKYKVVDNSNHLEAPPITDVSRKTAIAIDAAGLLYGQGETVHATALANIYKTNRLSRVANVEIIFYIQDDKTPGAKYALKSEDGVMPTPPEGFEKFFASYSQLQGGAANDLSEIGKEAVGKRKIQWDYPIDKDFGRRVLGNRIVKQAVAKYMCQQVFESTPIKSTQILYVMGPGFCKARTGKGEIAPDPRYCAPYHEGEYKCVELSNAVAEQYHMQIYSRDTDTVMAGLLAWPRILTIVAEDEATPVESIRFKNIVLTIQHWHEKNKPLSYIRMNEMWYALVLRMAVLARFVSVPAPRAATATLVAMMAFRGNDYIVQIPQLTPDRLLATFQQNFHKLTLPLVIEGSTARDFKMNCRGFLEFFLYAYKDKYPTIVVDLDNLEASYASVQAAVPSLQRAKVSYNAMRGRCANVCWYMRYLIASQMGQEPDVYYETNERGVSMWGYRRKSPELTSCGWEDVEITEDVDITHFDFGN